MTHIEAPATDTPNESVDPLVRAMQAAREFAHIVAINAVCDCDGWDGGHDGGCPAWPIVRRAARVPVLPVGTRVLIKSMNTSAVVLGPDGAEGDALAVLFDEPQNGFPDDMCCASASDCEVRP